MKSKSAEPTKGAMKKQRFLQVSIAGLDRPGIFAAFSRIILNHRMDIDHIEQASMQQKLSLHLMLSHDCDESIQESAIKDLLFEARRRNLTIEVQPFSPDPVFEKSRRKRLVLTHFGDTRFLTELSGLLGAENANIEQISSEVHHDARSFEMNLDVTDVESPDRLKQRAMGLGREYGADLAFQTMTAYRKSKRMVCFDMDSTLIKMEGIDEMARAAGVHREVARITEKAMRGDFDFEASLRQRVAMLKGLDAAALLEIRNQTQLSQGAAALLTTLKWLGFRLGIVSGGFDFFADHLRDTFDMDFSYANRLEIKNGKLTGEVLGDIVDAAQKARIVNQVSCDFRIPLDQVVAIGDGANDSLMLTQAGLGIAYNAKKGLDRVADATLAEAHFNHIFHLLGINEEDVDEAMACRE
jgi:phosphoserine phosphatase